MRRVFVTIAGIAICLVGIALLVLPGPGLLLVLGGLVVLATEYPWARRLTAPVRRQALRAAEQSVSSPARVTGSMVCAAALVGAGIGWLLVPALPWSGAASGSSLILSGLLLSALLAYSYRRVGATGRRPAADLRPRDAPLRTRQQCVPARNQRLSWPGERTAPPVVPEEIR